MENLGKNALILGLGESTLSALRFLRLEKVGTTLWDSREHPPFLKEIKGLNLKECHLGGNFSLPWEAFDFALIAPGLNPENFQFPPHFRVISEIELFSYAVQKYCPHSQILGITGANGKTTTTLLTTFLLNAAGKKALACGNISPSALSAFLTAQEKNDFPQFWVLELSSFQLEKTFSLPLVAAALLNITEDHLDRYHFSFEAYAKTKWKIFDHAQHKIAFKLLKKIPCLPWKNADFRFFSLDFPLNESDFGFQNNVVYRGKDALFSLHDLKMLGAHNALNAMASLMLLESCGVEVKSLIPFLKEFLPPAHRVQKVDSFQGIDFIDDSKGTNVGATLAALESLGKLYKKTLIILGGEGKGQDFSPLKPILEKTARAVLFMGKDGEKMQAVLSSKNLPHRYFPTLKEGFAWLMGNAKEGDCVLLSPACASLDQYQNYAERAVDFKNCVEEWRRQC